MCYKPVSSCWYSHFWFIFCFCLPLNPTVIPTSEVILLSQRDLDYCCVYHGQLFLPGFLLQKNTILVLQELSTATSRIRQSCQVSLKTTIIKSECDKVDRRKAKGNKERWYCGFFGNEYIIWNSTKALIHLSRSGGQSIARCRGNILTKYQRQFKALK